MEDIYMDYGNAENLKNELIDHSDVIVSDLKKIQSLLGDLNGNWIASEADNFTINVDGYVGVFNRFAGYYQDLAEKLGNSKKAYEDFDEYFLEKNI